MRRKILFYTHAHAGGGAELTFDRLARAFADAGDEVIFAADHPIAAPPADRRGLRRVVIGPTHAGSVRRLALLLRRERPDASFSALGAQNLKHVAAASLAGRMRHCVLGYHGFADAEPQRLSRLAYRLSPLTTRLAARTICVSDVLLDHVADRWGGSRARMRRIYNPVDLPDPSGDEPARDPHLILTLGRLVPLKRFADLVEAVARIPGRDARLAIAGEGPERAAIAAHIERLGLSDRVTLLGHVDDPSAWYRRAACVAITSQSESFGLTAAEALAHGIPVVTTACGGPPEILGPCGRVVPIGDVAALAEALAATLADPGDPARYRPRAASFALPAVHEAYAILADSLG